MVQCAALPNRSLIAPAQAWFQEDFRSDKVNAARVEAAHCGEEVVSRFVQVAGGGEHLVRSPTLFLREDDDAEMIAMPFSMESMSHGEKIGIKLSPYSPTWAFALGSKCRI